MNSRDYWQEREELHIKEMMEKDEQDSKEIARMYARTYRDIQRDINDFYIRYANENELSLSDAKKAVSKFDVESFRDKAAQYVRDKDFSDQANEELRLYNLTMRVNRLELLKSEIGLECAALGNDLDKYFMQTLTEEAKAEALRQAGILGETLETLDVKQIDKIVNGSWKTNMQTQPTFSEAIWGHNTALKNNIDTLLTQSLISGKHPRALADKLMKMFDASRYEAERLLRTESARVQGDVQMANFEEYGFEFYNIVREPTACKICIEAAANGPYRVRDKVIGLNMYPFHPNCRCSATPYRKKDN